MAQAVGQEVYSHEGAMVRLQQIGAEFVRQANGKQLYHVPMWGLFAVVQRRPLLGGIKISYYQEQGDCGC